LTEDVEVPMDLFPHRAVHGRRIRIDRRFAVARSETEAGKPAGLPTLKFGFDFSGRFAADRWNRLVVDDAPAKKLLSPTPEGSQLQNIPGKKRSPVFTL